MSNRAFVATLLLAAAVATLIWMGPARPLPQVWRDPSPHRVHFVTADHDVRLEVLDWGGRGRPVVLLTGSGLTAHVYDEFAPRLKTLALPGVHRTACCRVYAITRRGYGKSSHPASGYDNQRLADDVLAVLTALRLEAPILIGHSMAGGEMTAIASQHSDRLGGLVYLDALADPGDWPASNPDLMALIAKLPPPKNSEPADYSSIAAYRAWQGRMNIGAFPESELYHGFEVNPEGRMIRYKASTDAIHAAIGKGQIKRDYSGITVPVLALLDVPRPELSEPPVRLKADTTLDEERATVLAVAQAKKAYMDRWRDNLLRSVPDARLVDLPGAGHFVFLTAETKVRQEIGSFIATLERKKRAARPGS